MQIPFATKTKDGFSQESSREDLLNWFPVIMEDGVHLYGTPGTELWATIGNYPIRGWIIAGSYLYLLARDNFYRVANDGTTVLKDSGTMTTTSGKVSMMYNGDYDGSIADQIMIVDGTEGYIFDISADTFTLVARSGDSAGFPVGPEDCVFVGGRGLINESGTGRIWYTDLYDFTKISSLSFFTAEGHHDPVLRLGETNGNALFFGSSTLEMWAPTGNSSLPYIKIGGAGGNIGLKATRSLTRWGTEYMFLGETEDGNVSFFRTQGYQVVDASQPWMDYQITELTDMEDAVGYSYSMDGRTFYVVSFDTDNKTYSTDATNLWHRRETNGSRHISDLHVYFNDKHLVSDYNTGKIYEMKLSAVTDNGTKIQRSATGPNIMQGVGKFPIENIEIRAEIQHQPLSGQGSDPEIALDISKDDRAFGTKKFRSMGEKGEKKRIRWSRLGRCRKAVFRLTCDEPVNPIISGMWMNEHS